MLALRNNWMGLDSLFDNVFAGFTYPVFRHIEKHVPQFKSFTEGEDVVIEAALPGFDKEEVDIYVEDGVLTIGSSKEATEELNSGTSSFKSSFVRKYVLPEYVGDLDTEASLEKGILRLVLRGLNKETSPPKPKKLKIPLV